MLIESSDKRTMMAPSWTQNWLKIHHLQKRLDNPVHLLYGPILFQTEKIVVRHFLMNFMAVIF